MCVCACALLSAYALGLSQHPVRGHMSCEPVCSTGAHQVQLPEHLPHVGRVLNALSFSLRRDSGAGAFISLCPRRESGLRLAHVQSPFTQPASVGGNCLPKALGPGCGLSH